MEAGGGNAGGSKKGSRRIWSKFEEDTLLKIIEDFVARGHRCDTGSFKSGTMVQIEKALDELCPTSKLKAFPHIESKTKKWKKDYSIVFDMINTSGFAWNDAKKCIEVDSDDAWQTYVQKNKDAEGWRNKPFPLFERFTTIYGKDRATGRGSEAPIEMMEEQSHKEVSKSELGAENDVSPISMNQESSQSHNSQRKRKRATGNSSDGTDSIVLALKKLFAEFGKRMQAVTDAIIRGNEDRSDIANELKNMGLSALEQIDAMSIILDKPQTISLFKSLGDDVKEVFVRRLLSDNVRG